MAIGEAFTRRLLQDAGLAPGMRVLDAGSGNGDVTLIAAELVGPGGEVVGVDRNADAVGAARARAAGAGIRHARFELADLAAPVEGLGVFDAVIGRRVLMYLPDPEAALRGFAACLRPGGLVAFHEHDTAMVPASGREMPLHARVQGWLREMLVREGAELRMGFRLHAAMTAAGLQVAEVRAEALVQTPTQPYPLAAIVAAVMPRIVRLGVASKAEIGICTLEDRLAEERASRGTTYVADMMFGAWGRVPG